MRPKSIKMAGGKRKKAKADKNKPKRPLTAYNYFFHAEHERIREELEAKQIEKEKAEAEEVGVDYAPPAKRRKKISPREIIGFKELGKLIGKRWKEVGEEDLEKYKEMSSKDTERYKEESEKYHREQVEALNARQHPEHPKQQQAAAAASAAAAESASNSSSAGVLSDTAGSIPSFTMPMPSSIYNSNTATSTLSAYSDTASNPTLAGAAAGASPLQLGVQLPGANTCTQLQQLQLQQQRLQQLQQQAGLATASSAAQAYQQNNMAMNLSGATSVAGLQNLQVPSYMYSSYQTSSSIPAPYNEANLSQVSQQPQQQAFPLLQQATEGLTAGAGLPAQQQQYNPPMQQDQQQQLAFMQLQQLLMQNQDLQSGAPNDAQGNSEYMDGNENNNNF